MQGTTQNGKAGPLVSTDWLADNLTRPDLRIFDCTATLVPDPKDTYTVKSGLDDWTTEHIPGSGYLDIQNELSDRTSRFRFTMPTLETLAASLGQRGIGDDTFVVLYSIASPVWATRVWWMLRTLGFDNAAVLDGGFTKWKNEGRAVSDAPCSYAPETLSVAARPGLMVGKDDLLAAEANGWSVVNALSREQHGGGGTVYGRPGRIAGSLNVPTAELFDPKTTAFKSMEEIASAISNEGIAPDDKVIAYCGGGIAASVTCFLMAALGRENIALYDNSLSEWAKDPDLPMEQD